MSIIDAPTTEVGSPGVISQNGYLDGFEDTPELRFPLSVVVFDKMRRDAQVDSVLRAVTLPIRRTRRRLVGDDVRPDVIAFVANELGLDDDQEGRRRRRRQGIVFAEALRHALLMLPFGFLPMEQVAEVAPPNPGFPVTTTGGVTLAEVAHLRRLGPRMPRSLTGIDVARDGGLVGIRQQVPLEDGRTEERRIGIDRLAMFVNDREGAEWTGRSVLRSSYGHWLIKQRLMRLGPVIVERNGLGVPVVYYPSDGDRKIALDAARKARAGETAGLALPDGYRFELVGVTGDTRDELPLLKWHDEAMGRAALAMFLNLGHDNGARALGDTFVDYFVLALGAVVDELEATFTEYVIRDLVEWNYGPDEPYPALAFDPLNAESTPTAEALAVLAKQGLLGELDPGLTAEVRRRYGMPAAPVGGPDLEPVDGTLVAVDDDGSIPGLVERAERVAASLAALAARR